MQLVALVNKIASVVALVLLLVQGLTETAANTLQLVQDFINANKGLAVEVHPYTIDTNVNTILLDVTNGSSGLLAMSDKLDALLAAQTDALAYLTAKLDLLHNQPVKLPPIAPDGYGGGSGSGATPSEIWNFRPLMSTRTVGEWLVAAGNLAYFVGFAQARFQSADTGWSVAGQWWDANSEEPNDRWTEAVDITTILPTDATVAAWFERTTGRVDYIVDITGRVGLNQAATSFTWWLDITQSDFEILRGITGGTPVPSIGAPVWPGLANVTLGDVLILTDGMVVDGPLDGVIVHITGTPPPTGFYAFGARKSYVHIGAIVFISDNGDAEHSETIGLDAQVISVKGMATAASAVLRVKSGTVGTVQPWTITA